MRQVFADTFYWVALINPADEWSKHVVQFAESVQDIQFVTTDEVLGEVLAFYSKASSYLRQQAVVLVRAILDDPQVTVVEQTHFSFLKGLELYENRPDKGYSLTDCISMIVMQRLGISEVLSHDRHFTQEGFVILFKEVV
jgi:predicted nucleic acid-binding protein